MSSGNESKHSDGSNLDTGDEEDQLITPAELMREVCYSPDFVIVSGLT